MSRLPVGTRRATPLHLPTPVSCLPRVGGSPINFITKSRRCVVLLPVSPILPAPINTLSSPPSPVVVGPLFGSKTGGGVGRPWTEGRGSSGGRGSGVLGQPWVPRGIERLQGVLTFLSFVLPTSPEPYTYTRPSLRPSSPRSGPTPKFFVSGRSPLTCGFYYFSTVPDDESFFILV